MTDITKTVAPKTDQLNADDLLGGKTKTITITGVKAMQSVDQPIAISYEGDNGKPWKPCLGMRRVLIELWGEDAAREADKNYKGRRVTLFRDPDIKFGATVMGGIRISHASDIAAEKKIALTVSRARRIEFIVKQIKGDAGHKPPTQQAQSEPQAQPDPGKALAHEILNAINGAQSQEVLFNLWDIDYGDDLDAMKENHPERYAYLLGAYNKKFNALEG